MLIYIFINTADEKYVELAILVAKHYCIYRYPYILHYNMIYVSKSK